MPLVPKESLGKPIKKTTRVKNNLAIYAIFAVLLVELISILLWKSPNYLTFWYPLLTQIAIGTLVIGTLPTILRPAFCQRKRITYYLLSSYYLFNIASVLFQLPSNRYINIGSYLVLSAAFIVYILSLYQNEK